MQYWLDTIKWQPPDVSPEGDFLDGYYHNPGMAFDLRNIADQGVPNITAGRFVLCAGDVIPSGPDVAAIGEGGFSLTPGRKANLKVLLGLGEDIVADEVGQALLEVVYNQGDPSHVSRWKPPSVGVGSTIEFWTKGFRFRKRVRPTDPEFRQTIASKRLAYKQWRAEARAGVMAPQQHLKCLGYLVKLYGLDYHEFIGSEPDEGVRDPATTIGDDFTDTAGTSLNAHTASGANGGFSWTEVVGTEYVIDSDGTNARWEALASTVAARAESDLSSSAHYSQMIRTSDDSTSRQTRNAARYASSENSYIQGRLRRSATGTWRVFKTTTSTDTEIGTGTDESGVTNPVTQKMECTAADALTLYGGGVAKQGPNTDSTHNTNVRAGMSGAEGSVGGRFAEVDDFVAEDLAAGFDAALMAARQMGTLQPAMIPTGVVAY